MGLADVTNILAAASKVLRIVTLHWGNVISFYRENASSDATLGSCFRGLPTFCANLARFEN